METYERIRELRKNHLHLSQTEFGERLGVSRSSINNIERNALAKPEQKMPLYKLICSTFNVREEWLLDGIEPMYIEPDSFSLDDYVKAHGALKFELELMKLYFNLDLEIRKTIIKHFSSGLASAVAADPALLIPETAEELERQYPPIDDATGKDIG
ncbi:xRE family Transcriptional regulator [Roseburia sp. CAG:309]|nr:xRE family Transcriptional regulator [Roseburia sp. CAG:309]